MATTVIDLTKDNPDQLWFPSEGWGVFWSIQANTGKEDCYEAQRLDDDNISHDCLTDEMAVERAKQKRCQFNNPENEFEITNWKELGLPPYREFSQNQPGVSQTWGGK